MFFWLTNNASNGCCSFIGQKWGRGKEDHSRSLVILYFKLEKGRWIHLPFLIFRNFKKEIVDIT
jgi:hypothetical protein